MRRLLALLPILALLCACGAPAPKGTVDVDLTLVSDTVVLAQVSDMLTNPDQYMGKTVRMEGTFNSVENPATGRVYRTCLIADAMACCAQGFEFVLTGDDYPSQGDPIRVVGTFGTYEEEGDLYCQLEQAVLEPLPEQEANQ